MDTKLSKYKTIELISTFSKKDYRKFEKFLSSPFFNESHLMISLFEIFKNTKDKSEFNKFTPQSIHNLLFPGKSFNNTNIRKLLSNFNALLEEYLMQVNYEKYFRYNNIYLLREMNQRYLNDLFLNTLDGYLRSFSENDKGYLTYYNNKILLGYEEFRNHLSSFDLKSMHNAAEKIQNTFNEFLTFNSIFVLIIVKFHECYYDSSLKLNPQISSINLTNKEKLYYKKNIPDIYSGYLLYKIFVDNNFNTLPELLNYLFTNSGRIFYGVIDLILNLLAVILYSKYESGLGITKNDLLNLLFAFDKLGVVKRKRQLPPHYLLAYARFNSKINNTEEKIDYITSQIIKVGTKLQNDVLNLSFACIYYSEGDFDKAKECLYLITSKKSFAFFESKVLLLKICYEQKSITEFNAVYKKFVNYLKKSTDVPSNLKDDSLKFSQYLYKLAKLRKNKLPLTPVMSLISKEPPFCNKEYLLSLK